MKGKGQGLEGEGKEGEVGLEGKGGKDINQGKKGGGEWEVFAEGKGSREGKVGMERKGGKESRELQGGKEGNVGKQGNGGKEGKARASNSGILAELDTCESRMATNADIRRLSTTASSIAQAANLDAGAQRVRSCQVRCSHQRRRHCCCHRQ